MSEMVCKEGVYLCSVDWDAARAVVRESSKLRLNRRRQLRAVNVATDGCFCSKRGIKVRHVLSNGSSILQQHINRELGERAYHGTGNTRFEGRLDRLLQKPLEINVLHVEGVLLN
jgi:hypothetical protein